MPQRIARPSTEKALENRFAEVVRGLGYRSIHNDPTVMKGIPDRYVMGAGGLWVEVKLADSWHELTRGFERQRVFMDMLVESNDNAYVLGFLGTKENWKANALYFEPWARFKSRDYSHFFEDKKDFMGSPFKIAKYDDIDKSIVDVMDEITRKT